VQTCGLAASSRILSMFSIIRCGFTNLAHNARERACHNGWWKTCWESLRRKMKYRFVQLGDCRKRSFDQMEFSVLIFYNTVSRPLWICAHIHAIQLKPQILCLADPCWQNIKNYVLT
jgi:hypothetical protein